VLRFLITRLWALLLLAAAGTAHADVILLLSDERPAITGVAQAIAAVYKEKIETFSVAGKASQEDLVRTIENSPVRQVVAIGLPAAQLARQRLSSKQVVFCQVLNFEEADLVTPWMKGVSGIPSLARQFAVWKLLDPGMQRIGVVTGHNAQYMVAEATQAARRHGVEVVHIEVPSDRAVLVALQELRERNVQGLWLAPDGSVLSQRVIQDVMTFSLKNKLQVLAFSPALLKEGALLAAGQDYSEIARAVAERLRKSTGANGVPGEAIVPLAGARVFVSNTAASRFGLSVSDKVREAADVQ
jgi:putative ABC transport system substrate-binding protein